MAISIVVIVITVFEFGQSLTANYAARVFYQNLQLYRSCLVVTEEVSFKNIINLIA